MLRKFLDYSFKKQEEPTPGEPPAGDPVVPVEPPVEPAPSLVPPEEKAPDEIKQKEYNEFIEKLPEEFKDDPSLKIHNSFETLAKSYVHAQKQIGADKLVVPGKHATDEDWGNVFKKLGLPEDAKDYKIALGEDAEISEEFTKLFAPAAHELGILPKQAEGILNWYDKISKEQTEHFGAENRQRQESEMETLRGDWGTKFVDNMSRAKETFDLFADKDIKDFFDKTGMATEPAMIKFMANVSESLKEDIFKGSEPTAPGLDPASAQQELNLIMGDDKGAYFNKNHPGHQETVARVTTLMGAIN